MMADWATTSAFGIAEDTVIGVVELDKFAIADSNTSKPFVRVLELADDEVVDMLFRIDSSEAMSQLIASVAKW